ncbi:NAD(P)H-binding protein [Kribbella sp. NPDC051770]|uniref:SDR family oxidoreductase n=1 Tax=Kribbella sp. NPDC051770 TaxID=3155413 RepID=UPI0034415527
MILVTGATGNVGRPVVDGLLSSGADVRALVRTPSLPAAVEVVQGDLHDPAVVRRAAAGVDAAFLLWPSFDAAGAEPVVAALTEQVGRVVYLSALSAADSPASVWATVEQLLAESDTDSTFLRPGGFATNTLGWAEQIAGGDVVRIPSPKAGRSLIHERDIADVAVLALLEEGHARRSYELTGPEVLTQEQQVATIAAVLGRSLRVEEESAAEARQAMLDLGADEALAEASVAYWQSLVTNPEPVTTTVTDLTGNPGRTYKQWVEDHSESFISPR